MALLESYYEADGPGDMAEVGANDARRRKSPGEAQLKALERLQEVIDLIDGRARLQVGELPPSIIEPVEIAVANTTKAGRFVARHELRSVAGRFLYCAPQRRFYIARPGPDADFAPVSEEALVDIYDEWLVDWTVDFLNHLQRTAREEAKRQQAEEDRRLREKQSLELFSALTVPLISIGAVLMTPIGWVLAALFSLFVVYHFLFIWRLL
jgi:hypothetical protein